VHKYLLRLVLERVTNFEAARLEVSAVRARHELSEVFVAWEPSFQVVLLGSSVVQLSRNNVHHSVGQLQILIELFSDFDHFFMHFPGLLRRSDAELLDFLELVNSEDTPDVLSVSACLLSETRRDSCQSLGHIVRLNPLSSVQSRNWLFRSSNQVHEVFIMFSDDFVEVLFEVRELAGLFHDFLLHEERRLDGSVLSSR
jgi:hypothetical protein